MAFFNWGLRRHPEFAVWLNDLPPKAQGQIQARLLRIRDHGHFGDAKNLGGVLAELRWKNGWRVYFAQIETTPDKVILLILGGNKNGQEKDIRKARLLLQKATEATP